MWAWIKSVGRWWIVVFFVVAFVLTFLSQCARAADFEVQAGSKVIRGPTWAAAALVYFPRVIADKADVRCRILLYGPSTYSRNITEIEHSPRGDKEVTTKQGFAQDQNAQIGCQVLSGYKKLDLGLGVQEMMRGDAYNAAGLAFWLTLRWRFDEHWSAEYSHTSDAGTKQPNLGSDFLMGAYKF
jgi:hypothetical protein